MPFSDTYLYRAQRSHLMEYELETRQTKELARFDHVVEAPFYSGDAKALYYNCEGLIYRLNLETGKSAQVKTGACVYCNNDHVLSPDGTALAVSGSTDSEGMSKIYLVRLGEDEAKEIVSTPLSYLHGWSPDSKKFAYVSYSEE